TFFCLTATPTTAFYPLSLHDALPIYLDLMTDSGADVISLGTSHDLARARSAYPELTFQGNVDEELLQTGTPEHVAEATRRCVARSEEHTSELQSLTNLVCRLLLEKKK